MCSSRISSLRIALIAKKSPVRRFFASHTWREGAVGRERGGACRTGACRTGACRTGAWREGGPRGPSRRGWRCWGVRAAALMTWQACACAWASSPRPAPPLTCTCACTCTCTWHVARSHVAGWGRACPTPPLDSWRSSLKSEMVCSALGRSGRSERSPPPPPPPPPWGAWGAWGAWLAWLAWAAWGGWEAP
eukprot:7388647-Prymnesium_polylepis.1